MEVLQNWLNNEMMLQSKIKAAKDINDDQAASMEKRNAVQRLRNWTSKRLLPNSGASWRNPKRFRVSANNPHLHQ